MSEYLHALAKQPDLILLAAITLGGAVAAVSMPFHLAIAGVQLWSHPNGGSSR